MVREPQKSALSLLASRVSALTVNLSVSSRELTTDVPCLLVAWVTTMFAFEAAMLGRGPRFLMNSQWYSARPTLKMDAAPERELST